MSHQLIAEFVFSAGKSFHEAKAITIPARFYKAISEAVGNRTVIVSVLCDGALATGRIYWGNRVGGPYFQIKVGKKGAEEFFRGVLWGSSITVQIAKKQQQFQVLLRNRS